MQNIEREALEPYDLIGELKNLPSIGDATARKVAGYVQKSGEDKTQQLALLLAKINMDGMSQQSLFDEEGE